jgi:hypothetical protein
MTVRVLEPITEGAWSARAAAPAVNARDHFERFHSQDP